jgi:hypothetical protein
MANFRKKGKNKEMSDLNSLPVFLSASVPQNLVETNKAQGMFDLLVALAGGILSNSGVLVFGGHPSISPIIHKVALLSGTRRDHIRLFQLERFRKFVPQQIQEAFKDIEWFGQDKNDPQSLAEDLGEMRDAMVKASRAGIFIGGKTEGFAGNLPGIRDEYERFLARHPEGPVYLIGMLEGEALNLINEEGANAHRENLNSLQEDELEILRHSTNADLIASIILRDLERRIEQ